MQVVSGMATVRQVEAMGSQSGKPKCKVDIVYCGKATKNTAKKTGGAKAKGQRLGRGCSRSFAR